MAPRIIPEHGFDPSCDSFGIVVERSNPGDCGGASIKVQYDEWIGLDHHAAYCAYIPWSGDKISVAAAERLLGSVKVPSFIQEVSAIGMMIQCVNQTLEEIKEVSGSRLPLIVGLPSIVMMIESIKETDDDEYYFEDSDVQECSIEDGDFYMS